MERGEIMRIQKESEKFFDQDVKYVIDYLKSRKLNNRELNRIIKDYPFGLLVGTAFISENEEYEISHFLTKSEITGYDIKKVNNLLKTEKSSLIVFAVVLGDDVLCYDVDDKKVYLWFVQTGDGKKIMVSNSLTKFLKAL